MLPVCCYIVDYSHQKQGIAIHEQVRLFLRQSQEEKERILTQTP